MNMTHKNLIFLGIVILTLTHCSSNKMTELSTTYFTIFKENKRMYANTEDSSEFDSWLSKAERNYRTYHLKKSKLTALDLEGVKIKIIGAAWCSDTREQVPNFIRILEEISFPVKQIEYHFVDRDKNAPGDDFISNYSFSKVPTFIFYRDNKEIGTIIETPANTLEEDMVAILAR